MVFRKIYYNVYERNDLLCQVQRQSLDSRTKLIGYFQLFHLKVCVNMDLSNINSKSFILGAAVSGAIFASILALRCFGKCGGDKAFSTADQPLRFATAKANNLTRMLDIDAVYEPSYARGKVVLVTGKLHFFLLSFSLSP